MKTKSTNKFNILLMAIVMLLVFVAGFKFVGQTNSWLKDSKDVGFIVNVNSINILIHQGERMINNNGQVYLGAEYLEAKKYDIADVTITNDEEGDGYYIRFKVIALVNGVAYNINDNIETSFYQNGEWLYNTASKQDSEPVQMAENETKTFITAVTIPSVFGTGPESVLLSNLQGKHIKLFLYVEGSAIKSFGA